VHPTPPNTCLLGPTRVLNGMSIASVIFAQLTAEGLWLCGTAV